MSQIGERSGSSPADYCGCSPKTHEELWSECICGYCGHPDDGKGGAGYCSHCNTDQWVQRGDICDPELHDYVMAAMKNASKHLHKLDEAPIIMIVEPHHFKDPANHDYIWDLLQRMSRRIHELDKEPPRYLEKDEPEPHKTPRRLIVELEAPEDWSDTQVAHLLDRLLSMGMDEAGRIRDNGDAIHELAEVAEAEVIWKLDIGEVKLEQEQEPRADGKPLRS